MPYSENLDVRVTDSSLRDGSHAIRHRYTPLQVAMIAGKLDEAGVHSIGVGHGDGLGASSIQYMRSLHSDESRRDDQFNGRIMETSSFPTATFELTEPIDLGAIPANGSQQTYQAAGELTLHGVTNAVEFEVQAQRTGSNFQVAGSIPVTFADYGVGNPSFGPVTTEDNGVLEFPLTFSK